MFYFIKTPAWLKKCYSSCIWQMEDSTKKIYLSFDDGPHPVATPFVLAELRRYNAKATFFCIGKNVAEYPELYQQIIAEGHAVGNHTFNHLNGWKTKKALYLQNIQLAQPLIASNLFRPPYGKISFAQIRALVRAPFHFKIIMWTVLSGDFDRAITPSQCWNNVFENTKSGSIVVFHDSEKAWENLQATLPKVMQHFTDKGYGFEKIKI